MTFVHLDAALAEVEELGRRFDAAGHRLYLVGGIVRDQWLDRPLDERSDIDLTTDARPPDIKQILAPLADAVWTQGEKFGTIGAQVAGRSIEITTHRAETYTSHSRKPVVAFGDDVETDLSRRDFTVNAMAIALPGGELVDPWGGIDDLVHARLRTPLDAEISFTDDPLRMLRAARFATKYSLEPVPEVTDQATALRTRLRIVAIERIHDEIERLLDLEDPRRGLDFLQTTGLLTEVLWYGTDHNGLANPQRLAEAIETACRIDPPWPRRMAGLLSATFDEIADVRSAVRRLRLATREERFIVGTVRSARAIVDVVDDGVPAVRRWLDEAADVGAAIELARAGAPLDERLSDFSERVAVHLAQEPPGSLRLLDGDAVMARLDLEPGPEVGEALDFLREVSYELGPIPPAEQERRLDDWWAERAERT